MQRPVNSDRRKQLVNEIAYVDIGRLAAMNCSFRRL